MSLDPWSIRPAQARDMSAVAEMWLRSRSAAFPAIPAPVHSEQATRSWFAAMTASHEVWVAETDTHQVVGVLVLENDWIDQLYLDPAWTGRGLGAQLVGVAKRLRPCGLQLWTFHTNTRARQFYEREGFVATRETDGDNEERVPDVCYEWRPVDGNSWRPDLSE